MKARERERDKGVTQTEERKDKEWQQEGWRYIYIYIVDGGGEGGIECEQVYRRRNRMGQSMQNGKGNQPLRTGMEKE